MAIRLAVGNGPEVDRNQHLLMKLHSESSPAQARSSASGEAFSIYTLVNCMPPPYGGVSVHVDRLHRRLTADGILSTVCSTLQVMSPRERVKVCAPRYYANYQWLFREGPFVRADLFHAHGLLAFALPALAMSYRSRGVLFTFHDQLLHQSWSEANLLDRIAMKALFARSNFLPIAVSPRVREQLLAIGLPGNRINVIHAFIPPSLDGSPELPGEIEMFLRTHAPVLSVYGFQCYVVNGLDAPGFDMSITLMSRLVRTYPHSGLVVLNPGAALTPERMAYLRKLVADFHLQPNVLFVTEGADHFIKIFAKSTIYLRPTAQDGDAVAVREALAFGIPVVASDVAYRPKEVILFRSRDQADFERAVYSVLEDMPARRQALAGHCPDDQYQALVQVYRNLLKPKNSTPTHR
jgi:glycosyltransferase involved in cell wall biosynthesis